jgi:hypothetical protein
MTNYGSFLILNFSFLITSGEGKDNFSNYKNCFFLMFLMFMPVVFTGFGLIK